MTPKDFLSKHLATALRPDDLEADVLVLLERSYAEGRRDGLIDAENAIRRAGVLGSTVSYLAVQALGRWDGSSPFVPKESERRPMDPRDHAHLGDEKVTVTFTHGIEKPELHIASYGPAPAAQSAVTIVKVDPNRLMTVARYFARLAEGVK